MSTLSVRRPLALLAVLGMVATLLFAVAGTASAATVPSSPALFSACPDNADIPDAGFSDVLPGTFFSESVNCIAYYGTTTGTTPTTYDPGADVTRTQMAVFLYRMAPVAGVVLDSTPPDAGFTDISGLSPEAQTAINALADAGIVKGKTATTYEPAAPVWRQQMALFLARFSDAASAPLTGPGGTQASAAATTTNFTDIGATTAEATKAIGQVFNLGVATGTTATTYSPLDNVNRGQMSLFLSRLAGHMNVRPAGVNIQANPTEGNVITPSADEFMATTVSVTTRTDDGKFLPATNTVVDLWFFAIADALPVTATTAFLSDGTCDLSLEDSQIIPMFWAGSDDPCSLDLGDSVTDPHGNATYFSTFPLAFTTADLYAWADDFGAKFNVNTTDYSKVTLTPTRAADGYTIEVDTDTANLKYGETVTYTIQVTDEGSALAEAGWTFNVSEQWQTQKWAPGWMFINTGTLNPAATLTTDANGMATYTKTMTDPSTTDTNRSRNFVQINDNSGLLAGTSIPDPDPVRWYDELPYAYDLALSTPTGYMAEFDGATNTVTATLVDQYGDPMPDIAVWFASADDATDAGGLGGPPFERYTLADGTVSFSYEWVHTGFGITTAKETIDAWVNEGSFPSAQSLFYWVDRAVDGEVTVGAYDVLIADGVNDKVVGYDLIDYILWSYDDVDDDYNVSGIAASYGAWETTIAGPGATFEVWTYSALPLGMSEFNAIP